MHYFVQRIDTLHWMDQVIPFHNLVNILYMGSNSLVESQRNDTCGSRNVQMTDFASFTRILRALKEFPEKEASSVKLFITAAAEIPHASPRIFCIHNDPNAQSTIPRSYPQR